MRRFKERRLKMTRKNLARAAVAGAIAMSMGGVAFAAEPTTAELMQQIQDLQSKVQEMETKQQNQLTTADVNATVESVLRDADKQSKLLAMEGFTAGWSDGHFVLQSSDGNFKLMPMLSLQIRNVTNFRDSGKQPNNGNDDTQNGFEINHADLEFAGNAFTPNLTYMFRWTSGEHSLSCNNDGTTTDFTPGSGSSGSSSSSGTLVLEDAWVRYQWSDTLAIRVGQFKDPVWHEENVSFKHQLAVDRSLVNELLGGGNTDYVQGIMLQYDTSNMHAEVGYHDGYNTDNTNFTDVGGNPAIAVMHTDFGIAGRFEYALMGGFKGYDQFTSNGDKDDLLVVGAGFDWTQGNSDDVIFHTVDVQWNPSAVRGLSLYAAYLGVYRDVNGNAAAITGETDSYYDWGVLVQAGYMLNSQWEVFGRAGLTELDGDSIPAVEHDIAEFTAGVNYYLQGAPWHHNAKITVDLSWLPEGCPSNQPQIGVLANGEDDQIVLRGQFQLLL
jgi:hypothetical protein